MRTSSARRASRRHRGQLLAAALEALETRRLLANIIVNTIEDETSGNGFTSLREAIDSANINGEFNTITFDGNVFTSGSLHTIELEMGELVIADLGGFGIDIQGPGREVLEISGVGATRIFSISYTSDVVATISGMTISNGSSAGDGGAISSEGNLTLHEVLFSGNVADGADGAAGGGDGEDARGGAIHCVGTLNITNTEFQNNSAVGGSGDDDDAGGGSGGNAQGGAIYASGSLFLTDVNFSGNFATGGAGGDSGPATGGEGGDALGGTIYFDGADAAELVHCLFSGNSATGGAGGDSTTGTGGNGGAGQAAGFYSLGSLVEIHDSSFSSHNAIGGDAGSGATPGDGGPAFGGAIVNLGEMYMTGGFILSGLAFGGSAAEGASFAGFAFGGAAYNGGDLSFLDVDFTSDLAFGGFSSTGTGGSAIGGAIYNNETLDVADCLLQFNGATGGLGASGGNGSGGAIENAGAATALIHRSWFSGNNATAGSGNFGAIGGAGGTARGGAIDVQNGSVTVTDSTFSENLATGGAGGDATAGAGGDGGNSSGGAIANANTLHLANVTLYNNIVAGGAAGSGTTTDGDAGDGLGGGIFSNGAGLSAVNVTIASNTAEDRSGGFGTIGGAAGTGKGGGVYSTAGADFVNVLVADNVADTEGPDLAGEYLIRNSLVTQTDGTFGEDTGSENNLLDVPADLGPLTDNGGPMPTAIPQEGSLAIDAGNTTDATLTFGVDGTDQRGEGYPRIINSAVDIGALETGGADISVTGNDIEITSGDDTPSTTDFTDFGTAFVGDPTIARSYVVRNIGGGELTFTDIDLPDGYILITGVDTIPAGEEAFLTIGLTTAVEGSYFGEVILTSNASTHPQFRFAVNGEITVPGGGAGAGIHINFQPQSAPLPDGYIGDFGKVFADRGNGFTYGWNQNIQTAMRDREVDSDQRIDTLVHTQLYGVRFWEIEVPNGTYRVHLSAGDPSWFNSVYKFNVEGVLAINKTPKSNDRFAEGTVTVKVTDGKLTISNAAGAANNKLNFIDITPVTAINFQTNGATLPAGYLKDSGAVFGDRGNGQSYGWNQSASSFTRDRNNGLSPDQRYDTLIHTQLYGNRTWELAVDDGFYEVRVVAGDPSYINSHYAFNVEDQLVLDESPTSGKRWIEGTITVEVTDGRLTLSNAAGAVNNKIAFIEVTPAPFT